MKPWSPLLPACLIALSLSISPALIALSPAAAAGSPATPATGSPATPAAGSPAAAAVSGPVYAHRGGTSALVENTRENYVRAAERGSRLWETDVRFSSTNYPVLLHDADLGRFRCRTTLIANVSVTQARECTAANGQTITTLDEFADELVARQAEAFIELKTIPTAAQWTILETRLAPIRSRIVIQSFHSAAVTAASQRGYQTAFLTSRATTVANLPTGTDWYAPQYRTLTAAQVQAMHASGIKVIPWTVPCAQWTRLPAGVDALISDDLVVDCT